MSVIPYKHSHESKKRQVEQMFDNIASKYDLLNHSLSLNLDKIWRRKAIKELRGSRVKSLLDVASGTGDMIKPALKLRPERVVGVDLSEKMLEIARRKYPKTVNETQIDFIKGDSEDLPFTDNEFDAQTVAFGVRNFENPLKGLSEMFRVLKPGGRVVVLEFAKPKGFLFRNIFQFYFKKLLPLAGRLVSKDKEAYSYLPESVDNFPEREDFTALMKQAGFADCRFKTLTFGVAAIYTAIK